MRAIFLLLADRFFRLGIIAAARWLMMLVVGLVTVILSGQAQAATIIVDPAAPALTNVTSLGAWDVDGDFESWTTTSITSPTVSSGILSGTGSAATAQLSKLNFASGPNLDLGAVRILSCFPINLSST
ncbi:MAG: hypothetical protein QM813_01010 [Verrucomicrobiota bacterium]